MGQKTKPYASNGLEAIAIRLRKMMRVNELRVSLRGLEESIKKLPKIHRERIEKFFGLNGGPNHSKKIGRHNKNDVAFVNMFNATTDSLKELIRHEHMMRFNEEYVKIVNTIVKKVDKKEIFISDYDIVSYITAFFTFILNGPKMSFESDPLVVAEARMQENIFDKYSMIKELSMMLEKVPDNSINLKLLLDVFDMLDYKDRLTIQKSIGIKILDEDEGEEIPNLSVLKDIRALKEKMFPYGAWNVTSALIFREYEGVEQEDLEEFMEALVPICRNWSKISDYKVGKAMLQVFKELRTLDVYRIGGLEFTDPYEIMFLYLERNVIWS